MTFDWVTARNACSLTAVFEKLRLDVKTDVEMRHELRQPHPEFGFSQGFKFSSNGGKFSAYVEGGKGSRHSVIFALRDTHILVLDENDKELFRAAVTLSKERQCRLVVGQEEMEDWQFRKKALESLFFGEL